MKTVAFAALAFAAGQAAPAYGYETCENYEYAELKSMSVKELQAEYCKVEETANRLYGAIGEASVGNGGRPVPQELTSARDQCWAAQRKMSRLPRYKSIDATCPEVRRVDPLEAALRKARENLNASRSE